MTLDLLRPINLLSFPLKKHVFRKVAELAPEATAPISFVSQNFFVNFHLISLPQKLYHNFSSKYLFLERRWQICDINISFWNRPCTKCRSMNCKLDKVSNKYSNILFSLTFLHNKRNLCLEKSSIEKLKSRKAIKRALSLSLNF